MAIGNDVYNFLSSRAQSVIGGTIPDNTLSLIVEYAGKPISSSDKITFQIPPMSVTESKTAHYASENILGRFEPVRMYSNSEATRITFDVSYYWLEDSFVSSINSWEGVKSNVSKLRALLYPYNDAQDSTTNLIIPNDLKNTQDIDNLAKYVGKMTPPPICRLFFGDVYQGTPCILTGYNITYNGPWNDSSMAAVARRLAAQQYSRFSDALKQNADINLGNQTLDPVSRLVDLLPTNWGTKGYITNALQTLLRADKLFPLETKISITLETLYKFGTSITYNDIKLMPGMNEATVNVGKAKIISAGAMGQIPGGENMLG
jgi:hypothetical protein